MTLVDNIKRLCEQAGISISKLGTDLGFGNGAIYNWDKSSPSVDKILKVANYFNVSVDLILSSNEINQKEMKRLDTSTFIEAIRSDIESNLFNQLIERLQPEIERRLYANIFDVAEASRYLKISTATLRRLVKDGEIPFYRLRGQIFFRQIDLDKHIENLIENGR